MNWRLVQKCMFSPRLYKIYNTGRDDMYTPHWAELLGDKVITWTKVIGNISLYTSPFICMYIFKRGFFSYDETYALTRVFGYVGCLIAIAFAARTYGRTCNTDYVTFVNAITSITPDRSAYMAGIRKYDFEFHAWPVSYRCSKLKSRTWLPSNPFSQTANPELSLPLRVSVQLLAYIATNTFALRLIYPGSLGIMHNLLWGYIIQGRSQLVETFNGQRAKILTGDDNIIDTMFVDNRPKSSRGKTLVICCEGNAGFYEIGIMISPLKASFSVLGWNHPGFGGSTGYPDPSQEQNAIDAVVQYAINELDFEPSNIVMFGWSIGGYTAAWAAVNYPVKGLILDATFDDLLPLAKNQMPSSWSLLVKEVIRSYVDLNVGKLVEKYDGPVQLIRRTEDEIICLRPGDLSTNRCNNLLVQLINQRHRGEIELSPESMRLISLVDTQRTAAGMKNNTDAQLLLTLVSKYMQDYKSSHCPPLSENYFLWVMQNMLNEK